MKRPQLGAGGIFIFVLLLLVMVFIAAMFTLSNTKSGVDARSQTATSLANAAAALEQFASQTGRLPCPADPTLDTGIAVPNAATVTCTNETGTLPWATIGMRRDDAIDAWGWKIGYRVYDGNGGVTQDHGASMVNCDTSPTLGSAGVDANLLCRSTHATLPSEFIAGKGLSVTDYGTTYDGTKASGGAAYVLVSFGPSGFGAYTTSGTQNPNTPTSSVEKNNLKATGPFTLQAASSPDVSPSDSSHYDDVLVYRTIADLATRANIAARNWPDNFTSVTLNSATVQAALGQTSAPAYGSLNVTSMYVTDALVSSTTSGKLSFNNADGNEGIGINGGGSLGITPGEGIDIKFDKSAAKLAITLNDMGIDTSFFLSWTEQAQIQFLSGGNPVGSVATLKGCRADGQYASYTVTPGVTFDEIQLTSIASTPDTFFHTTISSNFYLSGFSTCDASAASCITALETANPSSHCSWP